MTLRNLFDLTDKVAIITGGAQGIGKAAAVGLAEFGADIVVADIQIDLAHGTAREVAQLGRKGLAIRVDVSDQESVRTMVEQTVSQFGRIDILFNNAGLTNRKPALEVTSEDWYKLFQVNLLGVFFCAQAVGRVMIQQRKGKIINSTSTVGVRGDLNRSIYASTKGGVIQLTKVLANEWGKYNIQVNAIGPGFIKTPLTAGLLSDREVLSGIVKKIPLGRVGDPEDLVGALVFLSSRASDFVTGLTLFVDGGWLVD